jgi:mannose-6-phosphate isomerase-like protein (cupin superfamily)
VPLKSGKVVLIERGEPHEIKNSGRTPLKTVTVYVPPAYTSEGNPLPAGEP